MKKFLTTTCAAVAMMTPISASAVDVSGSASIDYVTDYVFRGISFAGAAIQPGIELAIGEGFYTGAWASMPIGEVSSLGGNEIDFYAGYGFDASETIGVDLGITYYHFPQFGSFLSEDAGSYEVYGGLSFDTTLAPSVYAYYDWTLEAFTLEGSVGHSFPVSESASFDLGATAGYVDFDGGDFQYGQVSASLGFPLSDAIGAYVGANYTLASEDSLDFSSDGVDSDNLFWFGTGISADF